MTTTLPPAKSCPAQIREILTQSDGPMTPLEIFAQMRDIEKKRMWTGPADLANWGHIKKDQSNPDGQLRYRIATKAEGRGKRSRSLPQATAPEEAPVIPTIATPRQIIGESRWVPPKWEPPRGFDEHVNSGGY